MAIFRGIATLLVLATSVATDNAGAVKSQVCDEDDGLSQCAPRMPAMSLLQSKARPSKHGKQVEEGLAQEGAGKDRWFFSRRRRTPAPPTHFIQFDASTKTPIPRKEVSGLVREVVFRYPLGEVSVLEEGKKVHIPFAKFLESKYSRDTSVTGRSDFGVAKAMAFRSNKPSMISTRVDLMLLEKTHTTYSSVKDFPSFSKTRVEKVKASRWSFTNWQASNPVSFNSRTLATNIFVGKSFSKQVLANSVKDTKHLQAVRDFVASNGGAPNQDERERIEKATAKLAARAPQAQSTPIRSAVACMHFEMDEGIAFTGDGVDIVLGKRFTAFRGRLMSSPNQEYDFLMGYAVFQHNQAANSVDLYFAGSSMLEFAEAASGWGGSYWVGTADGASWPRAPEGRPPTPETSIIDKGFYHSMNMIPIDYTFLHQDRAAAGCPDSALDTLKESSDAVLASLKEKSIGMITHFSSTVPCSVEYLRPDDTQTAGYGILESLGFMHFSMEVPPTMVAKSLAAHIDWNKINGGVVP